MNKLKLTRYLKRVKRVRNKIGSDSVRLCVFKSNRYFSAQIIDDRNKKTLVSVQEKELPKEMQKTGVTKTQKSFELGKLIATKSKKVKVSKVVFDRGGYKYHGRIKSFAEGAREGGLVF